MAFSRGWPRVDECCSPNQLPGNSAFARKSSHWGHNVRTSVLLIIATLFQPMSTLSRLLLTPAHKGCWPLFFGEKQRKCIYMRASALKTASTLPGCPKLIAQFLGLAMGACGDGQTAHLMTEVTGATARLQIKCLFLFSWGDCHVYSRKPHTSTLATRLMKPAVVTLIGCCPTAANQIPL